ncbi:MAG: flavodoxin family protein [Planctomycetota bacterium]
MPKVAIVYHSGFGHTARVAQFVREGVASAGVEATLLTTEEAIADMTALDEADGIVFGTPTYMGGPSAQFKTFADATSTVWFEQRWRDKFAAGFTNSAALDGDKQGVLLNLLTFACQHSMIWISTGVMMETTGGAHGLPPEAVNRLGSFTGLATQSDNADPANTPSPGDIETAKLFGARFAEAVKRWAKD